MLFDEFLGTKEYLLKARLADILSSEGKGLNSSNARLHFFMK